MFWALVPRAARLMIVRRGYHDISHARPEHRYDRTLTKRFELYDVLTQYKGLDVIDNTADLENTFAQVKALI
jgi:hypothetical protein